MNISKITKLSISEINPTPSTKQRQSLYKNVVVEEVFAYV